MTKRDKKRKLLRRRNRRRHIRTRQQIIRQDQTSIAGEVENILRHAMNCQAHIVALGSLVFFSTETGDAWLLDSEDNYALQLMFDMQELDSTINETDANFQIEWQGTYQIEGDLFLFTESSGQSRSIFGYHVKDILQTIQRNPMGR
jgi:hypothetical protein